MGELSSPLCSYMENKQDYKILTRKEKVTREAKPWHLLLTQTVAFEMAFPWGLVATALYTPESLSIHLQEQQHNLSYFLVRIFGFYNAFEIDLSR